MICKNCGHIFDGNFCNNCGQNSGVDRINLLNFFNEVSESVLQMNKGFFYTFIELFIRPGVSIKEFINGKRKNHFKPLAYVLIFSTIYFLISQAAGSKTWMNDFISGFSGEASNSENGIEIPSIIIWMSKNFAYATLLLLPIFSLASYLIFLKSGFNYLEHIVLNSYITGQQAVFYSLFLLPKAFIEETYYIEIIPFIISIFYALWVFLQFFTRGNRLIITLRLILTYCIYLVFCTGLLFLFLLIQEI